MSTIPSHQELEVAGRRVFVRVDFNVPMKDGVVTDDTRIRASLPTLKALLARGGRLVVASHLGRPKGSPDPAFSLRPVAAALRRLLDGEVAFVDDCVGDTAKAAAGELQDGAVLLLENLRFHGGEKKNDIEFARRLAELAPLYVNDAFGSCHRAHASIVGVTEHVEAVAGGDLLNREVAALRRVVDTPTPPFALITGGAKVSDKIPVVEGLLPKITTLIIGGAMAYTFLKVSGHDVGDSLVEEDRLDAAQRILEAAKERGIEVLLPQDHVAATSFGASESTVVTTPSIPSGLMGLDIGGATCAAFAAAIGRANTIVWNGPMGVFERPEYASGTVAVAKAVADSQAYSVVGGGDSVAALRQAGVDSGVGHVSTGGGASLEFLAGNRLPGLEALERGIAHG